MRQIAIANLGTTSVIGMGCASLGSRIGRRRDSERSTVRLTSGSRGLTWRPPTAMQKLKSSLGNLCEASAAN